MTKKINLPLQNLEDDGTIKQVLIREPRISIVRIITVILIMSISISYLIYKFC